MPLKIKSKGAEPETDKAEHMKKYAKFYESGALDYETHSRMVPNIEFYANQAGIPIQYLYSECKEHLTERDLKYLHAWGTLGDKSQCGAYFTENSERYVERMYCMIAIVLRNLIDARFITLQDLIKELKAGHPVDSKLVCIPNFCLAKKQGGDIASWELSSVVGWILQRQGLGYQTVVYAEDNLQNQYGTVVSDLFANHMYLLK